MDNWCKILKILFKSVSVKDILEDKVQYQDVDRETFEALVKLSVSNYSGNEARNLYDYASGAEDGDAPKGRINVLRVLSQFDQGVLKEIEQIPVCRYRHLLKWRMVSFDLDEELFTTSFLAFEDSKKGREERKKFDWKYIIGNDNVELNDMLRKGLAENHFHLKGSAPYFSMTWLNLMNRVADKSFIRILKKYDSNRLQGFTAYHTEAAEYSLVKMCLQAALIRAYLYSCIQGRSFEILTKCYMKRNGIKNYIAWEVWDNERDIRPFIKDYRNEKGRPITLKDVLQACIKEVGSDRVSNDFINTRQKREQYEYLCSHLFRNMEIDEILNRERVTERDVIEYLWRRVNYINVTGEFIRLFIKDECQRTFREMVERNNVLQLLRGSEELEEVRDNLQFVINELQDNGKKKYDYAAGAGCMENDGLYGERWFLYKMFRGVSEGRSEYSENGNLFYAYLIIKERIRSELIQVNDGVGFDNFFRYQSRKEDFIDHTPMAEIYSRIAVRSSLESQKLLKLEARITPRDTSLKNRDYIAGMDKKILAGDMELKEKYFYVFHFIKEPEPVVEDEEFYCRHYVLRNKVKKQAIAIQNMRKRYPNEGSRVLGIDASSSEIGCRPEVFAQAYRYLRYEQSDNLDEWGEKMPRLRCTYHVGEDFLDIIDGMRAIDETIRYLNFTHGDRLGHALALGVSPREWYRFKGNRILCSRQELLDNLMWLYHRIRRYDIIDTENILLKLERWFTQRYNEIYAPGGEETCDINIYYDAWKLRGDDPFCYCYDGTLKKPEYLDWASYSYNRKYEELERIRKEKRCVKLFYRYHFDADVKRRGREITEFKIDPELIRIVEQVQRHLQWEVLDCGLGIETNPSSNYLIGTFRSYARHPIVTWNNKKLTYDQKLLEECPQLDVTINTDDQAVFGTSLENEYALMAVALEKERDEKGRLRYKKDMIYEWLDDIRKMGLERSFKKD